MDKSQLRKQVRASLRRLPDASVDRQSLDIASRVLSLPCLDQAQGVSLYLAMDKEEVRTGRLLSELLRLGKTLCVPVVDGPRSGDMRLVRYSQSNPVVRDKWGIPTLQTPPELELARAQDIDVVITPGLAFDPACRRLGRGRGYYDTFFTALDARRHDLGLPRSVKIGLCLHEQLVEAVPTDAHDVPLDYVVLAERMYAR
jgi:5-formyltetrahydrofolate cyclo-ligase